ncbi:MAG: PD-(D/E)XK nuclease family protein [Betaproteobacteria bacterium]|nr:MAG: PD-(D/E)XK nuclease family protein [Betaproteobacteria bacterium]
MSEAGPARVTVAPGAALVLVAHDLLADFVETAPDLTGAVVVLPNLHSASDLARALAAQAGRALLLPKITTLGMWAAEQPLPSGALPEAARESALFAALRSRKWFEAADLWPLTAELVRLFDELTQYEVTLPTTLGEFEQALEAAYQTKAGQAMQFEARLVYELWHASAKPSDGSVDPAVGYQLQLAAIARDASRPLYAVGLPQLIPTEQAFFDAYARRAPANIYQIKGDVSGASTAARFFASVSPTSGAENEVLRERAAAFACSSPSSPVKQSLRLYAAPSLEHEARAVDAQVRLWLNEGRSKIAVVALDRLVARRARALLERASVMIDDETGWIFSTTSASTVVMRWLDAVSGGFYYKDLLDLLKSPFVFAGWEGRREAVYALERVIRSHSIVAGLAACRSALQDDPGHGAALALEMLDRVAGAARIFHRDRRRRLHDWLSLLFGSLAALDVDDGLKNDPAGLQLVELLHQLARDLAGSEETFSFVEWRRWLDRQLELAEFRDSGVSSPVIFTPLSLTRLREFDAVLLAGCDASHLPGTDSGSAFFNQSVRAQLGLPTREEQLAQINEDLTGLLTRSGSVLVTWQELRNGEPNLLSPLFERMNVFHQLAWNSSLEERELDRLIPLAQVTAPEVLPLPAATSPPAPVVTSEQLPSGISASGYNSLVACPYQFYGRYVLGLREPDEVREETEKRDYGEYVHRVLRLFHARFPVCADVDREELEASLQEVSDQVFRKATQGSYLGHAWALRWRATIPAYLDWQIEREKQGWRFLAAESKRTINISLPDGAGLRLEGRLDRIDARAAAEVGGLAVVDYKARAAADLRRSIREPGEDVQLPVYAALLGDETREAFFLALDGKQAQAVGLDAEAFSEIGQAITRLAGIYAQMRAGAPLPAQGIDVVCHRCEMTGLCRKPYWP